MSHRDARLTPHGRLLLVQRVASGRPVAHVAKELGVSRQCAHRWVARHATEGVAGLQDRSSRPHRTPTRTGPVVEGQVIALREAERRGPDWLAVELGVPARTVSRILRRHQLPYLADCDPLTGQPVRAARQTTCRYEKDRPGELVHMDVKKIGKIPDGGGWRAGVVPQGSKTAQQKKARIGYDYVHSMVDDHSRLAYSEILPDEKGPTCAAFLLRAAAYFTSRGIPQIAQVLTDNHFSYRKSVDMEERDHHPRRPSQVHQAALPLAEREGGAIQPHPAGRVGLPAGVHQQRRPRHRPCPMAGVLQHSTPTHRTRRPPSRQPTVTNLMTGYI